MAPLTPLPSSGHSGVPGSMAGMAQAGTALRASQAQAGPAGRAGCGDARPGWGSGQWPQGWSCRPSQPDSSRGWRS